MTFRFVSQDPSRKPDRKTRKTVRLHAALAGARPSARTRTSSESSRDLDDPGLPSPGGDGATAREQSVTISALSEAVRQLEWSDWDASKAGVVSEVCALDEYQGADEVRSQSSTPDTELSSGGLLVQPSTYRHEVPAWVQDRFWELQRQDRSMTEKRFASDEGLWTSTGTRVSFLAFENPAVMLPRVCLLICVHDLVLNGRQPSPEFWKVRGALLGILQRRMADKASFADDFTCLVIVCLGFAETILGNVKAVTCHLQGLEKIVSIRNGIGFLGYGGLNRFYLQTLRLCNALVMGPKTGQNQSIVDSRATIMAIWNGVEDPEVLRKAELPLDLLETMLTPYGDTSALRTSGYLGDIRRTWQPDTQSILVEVTSDVYCKLQGQVNAADLKDPLMIRWIFLDNGRMLVLVQSTCGTVTHSARIPVTFGTKGFFRYENA